MLVVRDSVLVTQSGLKPQRLVSGTVQWLCPLLVKIELTINKVIQIAVGITADFCQSFQKKNIDITV